MADLNWEQIKRNLGITEYTPEDRYLDRVDLDEERIRRNKQAAQERINNYRKNSGDTPKPNMSEARAKQISADIDNLLKESGSMEDGEPSSKTKVKPTSQNGLRAKYNTKVQPKGAGLGWLPTIKGTFDLGANLFVPGSDLGTTAIDAVRLLKGVGQTAATAINPWLGTGAIAAGTMGEDEAKDARNYRRKVNIDLAKEKEILAKKADLMAQGYDELTAHQIAYGLPVQAFDDEELKQLEAKKSETDAQVAQAQKDLEKAKESYNAALAQAPTQPIPPMANNNDIAQPSGGDNLPIPSIPQAGVNDNVLAQVVNEPSIDTQLDVKQVEQPEGQVTTQDMLNRLDAYYNNLSQTIKNDPRYAGDIVQPNTPYNINPEQLARYQSYDQFAKAFGVDGGMADLYQNQARQMYDQQMANQLGVPYEDYIAATTERRKYDILAQSQQIQDALQVQANQAKDMQTKLGILQKMQEVREKANNDLLLEDMKGRYDLAKAGMTTQAQRDVANINAMGDIAKQQMYLTAPTTQLNAAGNYLGNLYLSGGGVATLNHLLALSPQQRVALWGQNISDDAIRALFANVRGIPAAALQQPQFNQLQSGNQGFLPGLANFINPQR